MMLRYLVHQFKIVWNMSYQWRERPKNILKGKGLDWIFSVIYLVDFKIVYELHFQPRNTAYVRNNKHVKIENINTFAYLGNHLVRKSIELSNTVLFFWHKHSSKFTSPINFTFWRNYFEVFFSIKRSFSKRHSVCRISAFRKYSSNKLYFSPNNIRNDLFVIAVQNQISLQWKLP